MAVLVSAYKTGLCEFKSDELRCEKNIALFIQFLFVCLPLLSSLFILSLIVPPFAGANQGNSTVVSNASAGKYNISKKIAILPFENLTDNPIAVKFVSELIKKELVDRGWVVARESDVEDFLAKKRIRYTAGITRTGAREMKRMLSVDAVLVGTANQFSEINNQLSVSVSVRVVSTLDGSILWADSLAYTGSDFVGILGLGLIKSMDILGSRLVRDLMGRMTERHLAIKDTGVNPFDIEKVETYPAVTKGGGRVDVRLKLLSIKEEPKEVRVKIEGSETVLAKTNGSEYEGNIAVPEDEGMYGVDVSVADSSMPAYRFEAAAKVAVDSTPPNIGLSINREVFSTNRRGYIVFTPKLISFDEIDEWSMEILDRRGKKIRGDRGYSKLPAGLIWRGETDRHGIAEDGEYSYKFAVRDVAGNETVIIDTVRVKSAPPNIKVDVDMKENKILFTFGLSNPENFQKWKLSIHDSSGKAFRTTEGAGSIPQILEYSVEEGIDVSNMMFTVMAVDEADNPFNFTKSISSALFKKNPFARVGEKGHLSEDF